MQLCTRHKPNQLRQSTALTCTVHIHITHTQVKYQTLNFAVKLALRLPSSDTVQSLAAHVLQLARFDLSPDLRDRARFMTALLGLAAPGSGVDEAALVALRARASSAVLRCRPPPAPAAAAACAAAALTVGSLSSAVGARIAGYEVSCYCCHVV
jgi:AP-3 complex subunit beta